MSKATKMSNSLLLFHGMLGWISKPTNWHGEQYNWQHLAIPYSSWVCYVDDQWLVKQFKTTLWTYVNSQKVEAYWKEKHSFNLTTWESVDWDMLEKAYKSSIQGHQRWAAKHLAGHFSHGKNIVQWNFQSRAECLCCVGPIKDKAHIIDAQNPWQLNYGRGP